MDYIREIMELNIKIGSMLSELKEIKELLKEIKEKK